MQTSAKGRAFLRSHEGEVLRAYRCPAGRWTIGVGLTAASGVVTPKAGMVITREESDRLLGEALRRNYEPRVARAMPGASSNAFDGGVSFDFNTGRIHNAGWVAKWRRGATAAAIRSALNQYVKGGGKVLPGLQRRRREEADVILLNRWPVGLKVVTEPREPTATFAVFVVSMTGAEIEAVREGFRKIGFDPGPMPGEVFRAAVEAFQKKYGLTVDAKVGRATLATLQRELDARNKATAAGGTTAGGFVITSGGEAAAPADAALAEQLATWVGYAALAAGVLYCAYLAWSYRDMIAARLAGHAPRIAAFLRSF